MAGKTSRPAAGKAVSGTRHFRRARRDGVAWSSGRVAASYSLNSLLTLGQANQTLA